MFRRSAAVIAVALLALTAPCADAVGVATASVDLGNEWLKIGLVKPGVPMDIVLNTESKRKTRVVIGLRNKERTFSDPAMVVATKYPKYAFMYLTSIVGVPANSDVVKEYQKRFPFHKIEAHPERGTVVFRLEDETYTVEELLAQILKNAVLNAAQFAEQEITGIVLTCPPYFNQAQRKALLLVGKIANIKILQLLNTNTAVGVNYGVFRSKTFNKTATNIIFYDMGATATIATVASYSTVKEKSQTTKGRTPQLEIKGVGYDRTLGGNAFDLRLRKHLLSEFMKNKKVKGRDVSKDFRAMEKLYHAAEKTKRVLSANKETKAQVEGLYDEIDFKAQVTREEFLGLTEDLFERVATPITIAMKNANVTNDDIEQIILFGGGLRIPKVQDILKETMGVEQLGKSINGDEAACLGASYQAAVLSKAFRVSKFLIKDINMFPILMKYNKTTKDGELKTYTEKIFTQNHPSTKPKILLFNRSLEDFHFNLSYANLSYLSEAEQSQFSSQRLSAHTLSNLSAQAVGHENDERKGVRVRFEVDISGMVKLAGAEVVFEREPEPEPAEKSWSEYLFGSSDDKNNATDAGDANGTAADTPSKADAVNESSSVDNKANATEADDKDSEDANAKGDQVNTEATGDTKSKTESGEEGKSGKAKSSDANDDAPTEEKTATKEDEKAETEDDKNATADASADESTDKNATASDEKGTEKGVNATVQDDSRATAEGKETVKPKKKVLRKPVDCSSTSQDVPDASTDFVSEAQARIQALVDLETERRDREEAYNNLEGGIYKARDELSTEEFESVSVEDQREKMTANLTTVSEWLDEDGWEANASVLKSKIKIIDQTMKSVRFRVAEAEERPVAIAALREGLNNTLTFYGRLLNYSQNLKENETEWHSAKELDDLLQVYNETLSWIDEKEAEQNTTAAHETPAVFSRHIRSKTDKLYREVSYLSRRPKPKPKKKKVKASSKSNITNTSGPNIVIDLDGDGNSTLGDNNSTADGETAETTSEPPVDAPDGEDTDSTGNSTDNDSDTDASSADPESDADVRKEKTKANEDDDNQGKSPDADASAGNEEEKDEL